MSYFVLFLLSFSCHSGDKKKAQPLTPVNPTVSVDSVLDFGLILDETISKPGADFYHFFYLHWQPVTKQNVSIRIQDQPGFLRMHFILLWLNDELVFRQQLPFQEDKIELVARRAVEQLNSRLLERLFIQKQLNY